MAKTTKKEEEGKADRRAEKAAAVAELTARMKESNTAVLADYRGMTVAQMQELRRRLRGSGVELVVVKNTLARRAADAAGYGVLKKDLVGPIAMAFAAEDMSAPARLLAEYIRVNRRMAIKSGLLQGQLIGPEVVAELADLPSREALIARLLGTMEAPLSTLARTLQEPVLQLARALDALKAQKPQAAPA